MIRYLRGWLAALRYVRMARAKKRGAGKQRWLYCWRGAMCMRYIVDGQFRGARGPRFLRVAHDGQKWFPWP